MPVVFMGMLGDIEIPSRRNADWLEISGETFECNLGRGIFGILRFALNDTSSFLGLAEFSAGVWRLELQIPLGYARGRLFGYARSRLSLSSDDDIPGMEIFHSHPLLRKGWGTRRFLTPPVFFVGKLLILWDRLTH
ncbi:MAG: hypothetical protein ACP5M4_02275 [Acidobacteriaceae bacterium]